MGDRLKVLINGATGRMGEMRHLRGALLCIPNHSEILELTLAGHNFGRTLNLAKELGVDAIENVEVGIALGKFDLYFDAARPDSRPALIQSAIKAGMDVYAEKPLALTASLVKNLALQAQQNSVITGVVKDKRFTPGFLALKTMLSENILGEIYDIRCEFGYWVSPGLDGKKPERPSWNYQKAKGGSLIQDIFSHWAYLIELISPIENVFANTKTHVKERIDENNSKYIVDVPDTAHVLMNLKNGATASISSSWIQRPIEVFKFRVFGSRASATVCPKKAIIYEENGQIFDAVESLDIPIVDEFLFQWQEMLTSIKLRKSPDFDFQSAFAGAVFCEAIEESALTKKIISMDELTNKIEFDNE
jgi:predicted dehydrogenase